ncbi:hypothetical protein IJ670_03360 [bacterium]|nr:hypothetical protein [bacterium]
MDNPTLTLLFVIFLIGTNMLLSCIVLAKTKIIAQLLIFGLFALVCIFLSGWFEVIKKTITAENIKETNFYQIFSIGVTKNIIKTTLGTLLYVIILASVVILCQIFALKFFGNIDFFLNNMYSMPADKMDVMQYFNNLSTEEKNIIYGWNFCILCGVGLFNFITMFYYPALFDETLEHNKNIMGYILQPIRSMLKSFCFLFKNIINAVLIGIFLYFINVILAIINTKTSANIFLSVIFLLVYIYFIAFVIMLIFNYYEERNHCNNRTDCLGQNENIN